MAYRDKIPAGGGLDGLPGFHVVLPGNAHRTQFLSWDKGKTVFRIYPAIANGREFPWREDSRPSSFSDWIDCYKFVKMMGVNDKFTCFVNVKGKAGDATHIGPIEKFSNSMINAIKTNARAFDQEWEWWVKGVQNSGRNIKIPKVEMWGFVQGALYECGEKVFMDATRTRAEPQHPSLLCLTKSARIGLEMLCNEEVPGFNGNPEDFNARYTCGDFLGCQAGKLVQFVKNPGGQNERPHYDVSLLPFPAPIPLEVVAAEWKPWDQLLHLLTEDEQMGLLVAHFPPEPLDYAFKGTPWHGFLPPSTQGAYDRLLASRNQMPGAAQPQGYQTSHPSGHAAPPTGAAVPAGTPTAGTVSPATPPPAGAAVPATGAPSNLPPPPQVAGTAGNNPYGNAVFAQPPSPAQPQAQPQVAPPPAQPNSQPAAAPNPYAGANFNAPASTPAPAPPPSEVHVPTTPADAGQTPAAAPGQPVGDASQSNMANARDRLLNAQAKADQATQQG
jgi:hypothetical protein